MSRPTIRQIVVLSRSERWDQSGGIDRTRHSTRRRLTWINASFQQVVSFPDMILRPPSYSLSLARECQRLARKCAASHQRQRFENLARDYERLGSLQLDKQGCR
jgi:hypothetical protein